MKDLPIQEAAVFLKVHPATLRRWEAQGLLVPSRTLGNQRRYTQEQLETFAHAPQLPKAFHFSKAQKFLIKVSSVATLISLAIILASTLKPQFLASRIKRPASNSQVLASQTVLDDLSLVVNVPAKFNQPVEFTGGLKSPDLLYGITAGTGVTVTGDDQNPTISVTDQTGNVKTFKTVKVGTITFDAGSNTDILTLAAGDNVSLSTSTSDKKVTISASAPAVGITDDGSIVRLTTGTDLLSVGSATGAAKLSIEGGSYTGDVLTASSAGNLLLKLSQSGTLTLTTALPVISGGTGLSTVGAEGQIFAISDGLPAWVSNLSGPSSGVFGYWQRQAGSLSPANITDDLLVGGSSTASALFRITSGTGVVTLPNSNTLTGQSGNVQFSGGISVGDGTTYYVNSSGNANLNQLTTASSASVSGSLTLYGTPTVATTTMQSLTLGNSNTGNIILAPLNGIVGSYVAPSTNSQVDLGTPTQTFNNIYAANFIVGSGGTAGYWKELAGALSPTNITDDLLVGGTSTASALLRISGTTGNLVTTGSTTLGDTIASDTVTFTSRIASIFEPTTGSQYDIGSSARRWATVYGDTGNFTNFSTDTATISGTTAADFLINSDNVTADTENSSLTFERGAPATNVQFLWNATTKLLSTNTPSFAILGDTGIAYSGQAALIINQVQAQDILTASASGVTRLTLTNVGNLVLGASSYLNFGTTSGTTGYGLRDNAGTVEIKSSGGGWSTVSTWTSSGSNLYNATGTNIGVNTTSPVASLDVVGSLAIRSAYAYEQDVSLTNSGGTLTNYDVLIERDTATLITAGKMQSDCDDIRFTDSDKLTPLVYWIEQGCNTANTQIWVRVPSIPNGSKTIYMLYGKPTATAGGQSWAGNFVLMSNASCPSGWTRLSALDSKFPRGNSTYGTTGGATTHPHSASVTTGGPSSTYTWGDGGQSGANASHTHSGSPTSGPANNLPSYINTVFCTKSAPLELLPTNFILWHTSLPSGWSNVTAMNTNFPYGAATYGGTGGTTSHSQTLSGSLSGGSGMTVSTSDTAVASSGHSHSYSGTLDSAANNTIPPYEDFIPATPDSASTKLPQGVITSFDTTPPLGWTRRTSLDAVFPRANSTAGGTGGTSTHTHAWSSFATAGSSGTVLAIPDGGSTLAINGHTHTVNAGTSGSGSQVPPYTDFLYYTKNTMSVTIEYSAETSGSNSPVQVYVDGTRSYLGVGQISPQWGLHVTDTQSATASAMIENLANVSSGNPTALALRLGNDGTNPDTGDRFINFMSGYSAILGKIQGNGSGGVTYATAGVDFAEYFTRGVGDDFSPGTAVCHTTSGVSPCLADEIDKYAGIVSTAPAFLGGTDGPDKVAVGLVGQLPARVATDSAAISPGDKITLSGVGLITKASPSQPAIGRALGPWDPANPTPTIPVLVSPLTNLSLTSGPSVDSGSFTTLSVTGPTLLSDTTVTGQLQVGLLTFDDLASSISSLTGTITVKGDLAVTGSLKVLGSSAGSAVIPAGSVELLVPNDLASSTSAVFATAEEAVPIGTQATNPGEFIIKIPSALPTDLKVKWWIVN